MQGDKSKNSAKYGKNDQKITIYEVLATRDLHRKALAFEEFFNSRPVIALNFDNAVFHSSADTTALFQYFSAGFERRGVAGKAGYNGDGFSSSAFRFPA